ncbi:hypothetical protein D3C71_1349450 [compost metagenome]
MLNALGGEFDVRIHHLPALGFKLFYRQHLAGRLTAFFAASGFFGVGVRANQRRQIGEAQLLRQYLTA